MKKNFILFSLIGIHFCGYSQTNTFPATGNVGIGRLSAGAKLDVYQSELLGTELNNSLRLMTMSGNSGNTFNSNYWLVRDDPGNNWFTARQHEGISIDNSYLMPRVNTRTWWERDPYHDIQSWGHIEKTYLTINQGKIGIGTTLPMFTLDVRGSISSNEESRFSVGSYADPHIGVGYAIKVGSKGIAVKGNSLFLDNVGIGTTDTKGYKLAIAGKMIAEEIKVKPQGSWPDYVFDETYRSQSLPEIEQFIKANKHLPEIPSASAVQKEGIDLGEMNAKLLKKIEELTLHLIEQNKRIEKLEKANN